MSSNNSCVIVTSLPVYQTHGGSLTQQSLISSQSDDLAMIAYHHAVTSPGSVSPSRPPDGGVH